MAMNETCNSPHGDFGRSTACNEDKSIYRVSIPIGTKCCPFVMKQPWYNQPNTRELTNHPGKSAISRTQNWFLLLADWAFSSGCGQVPLVSGRPCYKPIGGITSTPVWLTTLSTFLWGITRLIGESDWVVYIEKFILSTWLYFFSLLRSPFDKNLHGTQIHSCFLLIQKIYPYTYFTDFLITNF